MSTKLHSDFCDFSKSLSEDIKKGARINSNSKIVQSRSHTLILVSSEKKCNTFN